MKYIFIISLFFDDIKIYFLFIQINFYSMKYFFYYINVFFMLSSYILFNQNNFAFNKKYFYHIYIFHSRKFFLLLYEFLIHNFSGEHIWSSICIYESQNFTLSMQIEQQHEDAEKLQRRILECCVVKAK